VALRHVQKRLKAVSASCDTFPIHYRKVHKVAARLLFRLQAADELLFLLGFMPYFSHYRLITAREKSE
jgi:hypothetical protein